MGAGGVGGYFGARLQQAGHEVTFFARGRHLEAIRANGLKVESPHGDALLKVRVLEDPATRARHLFVVNQHPRDSYTLTGLPYASIESWEEVSASSYAAGTPLGRVGPETVRAVALQKPPDAPLTSTLPSCEKLSPRITPA